MPLTLPNEGQWIRCPNGTGLVKKSTLSDLPGDRAAGVGSPGSCCEPKCPKVVIWVFQLAPQYPCGASGFNGCVSGDCNYSLNFYTVAGEGAIVHVATSPFGFGGGCIGLNTVIFDYVVSDALGPTWTLVYGPDANNAVAYAAVSFKCGVVPVLPPILNWQAPNEPCGFQDPVCFLSPLPDPHGHGCGSFCVAF